MKDKIIAVLANHKGKNQAITVAEVASLVSTHSFDFSCSPVRAAIREIIENKQLPIGSCNKGYYLIETEQERSQVINDLMSRIIGIQARIGLIKRCQI